MSESLGAAESAVVKLEEWFTGLSPDEQSVIAPIIAEGILATIEGVSDEVEGYGQSTAGPELLQVLGPHRAPTITWLVGLTDWVGNAQPPNYLRPARPR